MSPVRFKKLKQDNLYVIQGLDLLCFGDEGYQEYDEGLTRSHWWVGYVEDSPVCYAGLYIDHSYGFLERSGVLPSHRGKGLQKRLIKVRQDFAKKRDLEILYTYCDVNNPASINSLIKQGFKAYNPGWRYANADHFIYLHKAIKNVTK